MKFKMKEANPNEVVGVDDKLKEFEKKSASIWEISKALIACAYNENQGSAYTVGTLVSADLVAFYDREQHRFTEYIMVHYLGGAYTVRNATGNSVSADLQEIASLANGGYYEELDDFKRHMSKDIMISCQPQNARGYRLIFTESAKFGVVAIDIPWGNSECIGVYGSLQEAAKAAKEHLESCAETFGYEADSTIKAEEGFQEGRYYDPKNEETVEDDGYRYLIAECPKGGCVYVLEEPHDGSDPDLHGPYRDYEEANADLFVDQTDENGDPAGFKLVPGTFGPGFYPVDVPDAALYHIYVMEE